MKMKKFLALILCVCIVLSFASVSALAQTDYTGLIEECLTTEVKTAISKDLTLIDNWNGTPITWESSNESVIDNEGKVTRKSEDVTVTLTAKENGVAVKTLTFVVLSINTNVWYSENFYRPSEAGNELRASNESSSHSLDFTEKATGTLGKAGFYKHWGSTHNSKANLKIAQNPNNANDYSLLSRNNTLDNFRAYYNFSLPDGILPTGKVTVSWNLTTTGYKSFANRNGNRYVAFYDGKGTEFGKMSWLAAGDSNVKLKGSSTETQLIYSIPTSQDGDVISSSFSLLLDFDEGTASITEASNGVVSNTKVNLAASNKTLKRMWIYPRFDDKTISNPDFYIDDMVITSTRQEIVIPEKTRKVTASYTNSNCTPEDISNKDRLDIKIPYNEKYNQNHTLRGFHELALTANTAIDLSGVSLVKISDSSDTVSLSGGGDERAACYINGSWMGATHGENSGVYVTSTAHGKTPADVGSRWTDASGNYWNLLRVVDEDTLMFISDNQGTLAAYSFLKPTAGTAVSLTHAGNEAEKSDAVHKEAIEGTVLKIDQIWRSYKKPTVNIYTIEDGVRTDVTSALLETTKKASGDAIEFVESYTVINPATIADGLRQNRTYQETENPDLAVGEGMLEVKNTYRYDNTGTVLVYMEYKALMDIDSLTINGIQYREVADTYGYGGGIYKYIPKVKPVEDVPAKGGGTIDVFDLTQPWYCNVSARPSGVYYTSDKWEDSDNPPNREVIYYKNSETEKFKAAFSAGFLPIDSGVASVRKELIKNDGYYYYQSNKGYPRLVGKYSAKAGEVFKGVAFRKYSEISEDDHNYTSIVPVNEGENVYYYIDYHKSGTDTTILPTSYNYELVEKSSNTQYSHADNLITTSADCSGEIKYGYIVLKATKKEDVRIADGAFDKESGYLTGYIQNDAQESKTLTALAAIYNNDGKLLETITIPNITVEAGEEVGKVFPFKNKNAAKAKIFTFNSVNVLKAETTPHYATVK